MKPQGFWTVLNWAHTNDQNGCCYIAGRPSGLHPSTCHGILLKEFLNHLSMAIGSWPRLRIRPPGWAGDMLFFGTWWQALHNKQPLCSCLVDVGSWYHDLWCFQSGKCLLCTLKRTRQRPMDQTQARIAWTSTNWGRNSFSSVTSSFGPIFAVLKIRNIQKPPI